MHKICNLKNLNNTYKVITGFLLKTQEKIYFYMRTFIYTFYNYQTLLLNV